MLTEIERLDLRDQLFAKRFQTGHNEQVFELLAVLPGEAGWRRCRSFTIRTRLQCGSDRLVTSITTCMCPS